MPYKSKRQTKAYYATKQVAKKLHISPKTVEAHRLNMMDKLKIDSIAQLTKYAIQEGLTYPETAQILELPEGTVCSRLYHARREFRIHFERLHKKFRKHLLKVHKQNPA